MLDSVRPILIHLLQEANSSQGRGQGDCRAAPKVVTLSEAKGLWLASIVQMGYLEMLRCAQHDRFPSSV